MKIRMIAQRTGGRYDGQPWPGPGGEINVPDEEGRALCAQGDAAPVAEPEADVETRQAKPAATEAKAQPAAAPAQAKAPAKK